MDVPDDLLQPNATAPPWSTTPVYLNASHPPCPAWPHIPMSTVIPAVYSVICVLGTVANALAAAVLAHGSASRRTVANTFMLNLCVSDLLFLLSLPLWAVYYSRGYDWPFGGAACKICGFLLYLNLYASIFFITAMSVDRYLAIVHPFRSQRTRGPVMARLTCVLVWVLACLCSVPPLVFRDTHYIEALGVEACAIVYPAHAWHTALVLMKVALAFLLPLLVITCCYCAIGRHLLGGTALVGMGMQKLPVKSAPSLGSGDKSKRPPTPGSSRGGGGGGGGHEGRGVERVLWTVAAVVFAFFFCWSPFHCVSLVDLLWSEGWVGGGCGTAWAVTNLVPLTLCLGFSNSAINPVLYCFIGNHFRGRLGGLCKDLCACLKARGGPDHGHKRGSFSTRLSSFSQKLSDLKDLAVAEPTAPD